MNKKSADRPLIRATEFASSVGAQTPVFLAPMAGACSRPLCRIAVANAGGMGACGGLLMSAQAIAAWADEFRKQSTGPFQMNLWVPDSPPVRNEEAEARQREFLGGWGQKVPADAGNGALPDFEAQCRAMIETRLTAVSSLMGLYSPSFIAEIKAQGIRWFATATTVAEARAAERPARMQSLRRKWKPEAIGVISGLRMRRRRRWDCSRCCRKSGTLCLFR